VKLFSTIEPYELTKIMDAVKPAEFKAGAEIIKEVVSYKYYLGRNWTGILFTRKWRSICNEKYRSR
jgi:hypothetical protein